MFELSQRKEAPKTVIVYQRESSKNDADTIEEITLLAESAGCEVHGIVTSSKATPNAATFIGKGKVEELADLVEHEGIELVILNHAVSPIQERNLEKAVKCRVLDRTGLILDIFALRASSHEGKLQVELAQLQHISTRLVRGWTHLERQKGGIGLRGPGETQLETDRRLLGFRIKTLHQRLTKVSSQRELRRKSRKKVPIPTVSLVGYTNAGKSSLMNALTKADVYVEDQLFATLDTTMRKLKLPSYGDVILSDTVGFIKDLPHSLVNAFHSTLEEVENAHLLLHVVDSAAEDSRDKIDEVNKVLKEISANDIPIIMVHNKIDRTELEPRLDIGDFESNEKISQVWVSAHSGEGIDLLLEAIERYLQREFRDITVTLTASHSKIRAQLYERSVVEAEKILEDGSMSLDLRLSSADFGWLEKEACHR